MNRWMIRLAFGAKCGCLGASGLRGLALGREQPVVLKQAGQADDAQPGAQPLKHLAS